MGVSSRAPTAHLCMERGPLGVKGAVWICASTAATEFASSAASEMSHQRNKVDLLIPSKVATSLPSMSFIGLSLRCVLDGCRSLKQLVITVLFRSA